jgi:SOS-response transcriptional repressor LexA
MIFHTPPVYFFKNNDFHDDVAPTNETKKTRLELPKQQKDVLEFIRAFRRIRGFAPTLQELATGMGLRSRSNMHRIVKELVSKGLLSKKPLLARTLKAR